jgi:hypothetical protein
MKKKEEDCEKLEQEVVSLRKSLRNSQVPKYLTHLGCMGETSLLKLLLHCVPHCLALVILVGIPPLI